MSDGDNDPGASTEQFRAFMEGDEAEDTGRARRTTIARVLGLVGVLALIAIVALMLFQS